MRPICLISFIFGALFCSSALSAENGSPALTEFHFQRENVLGTSFDLTVCAANEPIAQRVENAAMAEIDRLRRILSTYEPSSELSRINASHSPVPASPELIEVLAAYENWIQRSGGAYSAQVGRLSALWREAERSGVTPSSQALSSLIIQISHKAWSLDAAARTITRTNEELINIDSAGKGFIIGKVVEVVRRQVPEVRGLLLNIGGDIRVWGQQADGKTTWKVGVADPRQPSQNARPITEVLLSDRAVSTSGDYARGFNIKGHHFSHILDPRTGLPAAGIASATVIAPNNVMGNALATTLCVLTPEEGLKLVGDLIGVECLIVTVDGVQHRSSGFSRMESPAARPMSTGTDWPFGYTLTLDLHLKSIPDAKRPYVVVWIENDKGQPVRNVTLWARNMSYVESLTSWFRIPELNNETSYIPVTRATRSAGNYSIVWDGTDNVGHIVPKGLYTLYLEVAREHGTHATKSVSLQCASAPSEAVIPASTEFDDSPVKFGPAPESP
ncbi:MAG: apbE 3 [Verrucomicrobiales bacterium]|nr:apbE 3 [Verrucomicrobiales bacterium]